MIEEEKEMEMEERGGRHRRYGRTEDIFIADWVVPHRFSILPVQLIREETRII